MQKTSSWCDWLYLSLFCAYFKIRRLDPGTHNMLWGMMCLGIQCLKLGLRSAPAFHHRTLKWPISADVPQSAVVVACTLEWCTIMSSNAPLHFSHFLNFWAVMALYAQHTWNKPLDKYSINWGCKVQPFEWMRACEIYVIFPGKFT